MKITRMVIEYENEKEFISHVSLMENIGFLCYQHGFEFGSNVVVAEYAPKD